ncbi:hypothetical protein ACPXCP_31125 [Streptomyces sp. DT20]|uniref:hypothetical protein n=1 Tax=Streptomyces sp. DT20 TaxID=3416519 RepID=UPI003CE92998
MKVRADIAAMLRDGHTQTDIMATLHVGPHIVTHTRRALHLTGQRPGRKPLPTLEQALRERVTITAEGCWMWNGPATFQMLNHRGARITARRAAFTIRWGRDPAGTVTPVCEHPNCAAPDHMQDRPMREQLNAQYAAIFGPAT